MICTHCAVTRRQTKDEHVLVGGKVCRKVIECGVCGRTGPTLPCKLFDLAAALPLMVAEIVSGLCCIETGGNAELLLHVRTIVNGTGEGKTAHDLDEAVGTYLHFGQPGDVEVVRIAYKGSDLSHADRRTKGPWEPCPEGWFTPSDLAPASLRALGILLQKGFTPVPEPVEDPLRGVVFHRLYLGERMHSGAVLGITAQVSGGRLAA